MKPYIVIVPKAFVMTDYYFLDDIKNDNGKLIIDINKTEVGKKLMVVYTDIYGNDFTESFDI